MATYQNSSCERPDEIESGGRGTYCCIPNCGNSQYDRYMQPTKIGLFRFPNEQKYPKLRKKWISAMHQFRRKGGSDSFTVKDSTRVCEFHFKQEEIRVSKGIGRKSLVSGAVPSIFKFKIRSPKKKRKSPTKRSCSPIEETSESEYEDDDEIDGFSPINYQFEEDAEPLNENPDPVDYLDIHFCCRDKSQEIERLKSRIKELETENASLCEENENLKKKKFNFENVSADPTFFKKITGIETDAFDHLYEFLNPGEKNENIKYYVSGDTKDRYSYSRTKPGPTPKHDSRTQLLMFLIWLRTGITLHFVGWLFDLTKSTVSHHIITWSNFLYFSLGSIPIWPSRLMVNETMPETFRNTYPTTRCIIDATELFCQRPSSLTIQSALYSSYKHHVTYKGLVGIAPSGAITFVSQLYDGSISDKELVVRCGILKKELWDEGDSMMADRGFTIEDDLKPLKVGLNIPAFLGGREQLTEDEVKESQGIAAVRIHVERAIQRIKKFRQIRNEIPLTLHGSINQIWTVACLLCNILPPLIQKDSSREN